MRSIAFLKHLTLAALCRFVEYFVFPGSPAEGALCGGSVWQATHLVAWQRSSGLDGLGQRGHHRRCGLLPELLGLDSEQTSRDGF